MKNTSAALCLLLSLLLSGCATNSTTDFETDLHFTERKEQRSADGLTVSVAALGREESIGALSAPFNDVGIQPVWIEIENQSSITQWVLPIGIDDNYFPSYEAANRAHLLSPLSLSDLHTLLEDKRLPLVVKPGALISGFVYTHSDEGMKSLNVRLHGASQEHNFHFVLPVPGLSSRFFDLTPQELYPEGRRPVNEAQLKEWIASLPCCVVNGEDTAGDPINLVFVGDLNTLREALISNHWDVTAPISGASVWRMFSAYLFGSRYRYAPISPLYLFNREQDLAFQKARAVIDERNHMRLWLAPVRYNETSVWVGQVSRDVGIKFSGRFWPPTTHVIDPDMDDARFYITQEMIDSGYAQKLGFVESFERSTLVEPRFNAESDPYFSDGYRAVYFLVPDPVTPASLELKDWDIPDRLR